MRCPHHSWREIHQSREFSNQLYHVLSCDLGISLSSPVRTACVCKCVYSLDHVSKLQRNHQQPTSTALLAISLVLTYHCGLISGSTMSFDLLQMGTTMGFSFVSRYRPFSLRASRTAVRASKRFIPCVCVCVCVSLCVSGNILTPSTIFNHMIWITTPTLNCSQTSVTFPSSSIISTKGRVCLFPHS